MEPNVEFAIYFVQFCIGWLFIFVIAIWMQLEEDHVLEEGSQEIYVLSHFIKKYSKQKIEIPKKQPTREKHVLRTPRNGVLAKIGPFVNQAVFLLITGSIRSYEWCKRAAEKDKGFQFVHLLGERTYFYAIDRYDVSKHIICIFLCAQI